MPQKKSRVDSVREPGSRTTKTDWIIIIVVGLLLRVIYDIQLTQDIFWENHILDSLVLHTWAQDILSGNTADLAFFRAPLYPYLLAGIYKVFGVHQLPVVIFQNLLGILTALMIYRFAFDIFKRRSVALTAGLITVAYPTLIIFEGEVMITALEVFLYTLTCYLIYLAVERKTPVLIFTSGIALGLAAITRPIILPVAVIFPALIIYREGVKSIRKYILPFIVYLLGIALPIFPVIMSNMIKGGEFVLISTQGGSNFFIGNSSTADGITVIALGPQLRIGKYQDNIWTSSIDEADRLTGRRLS